ncbi:MAG: M48 family metallopeptidase [Spirochaetes bacterium]|nr:M48 family metallopeptidase [Spirochaetota bacterium]
MKIYLIVILLILTGQYLLDLLSSWLNVQKARPVLPKEFRGYYKAREYKRSQVYLKEKTFFEMIQDTFNFLILVGFILAGGFNILDGFIRSFRFNTILTGIVFTFLLIIGYHILNLPFAIYHTFIIEEKYGFNRTTPKTFILDLLKSFVLLIIIGSPILALVLWLFESISLAWFFAWLTVFLFQLVLLFIFPVVLLPLFNKMTPLKKGRLRVKIERYARKENFKMQGIFTMDGSRRSTKSNAFFTGFGRLKRIVLFDTLISQHTDNELVSILAHEMSHFKNKHIIKMLFLSFLSFGFMFFILSVFINNPALFAAFKMEHISVYASLVFFGFLYSPISLIQSFLANSLSRKFEFEADRYAVKSFGHKNDFLKALKKLSVHNLTNLTPHPLKVILSYSHPPVLKRIERIKKTS